MEEEIIQPTVQYTDDNIRHLSDMEHVRTRPGMYIGKLGDGSHAEDGIYVLLKEVLDNSIDEFKMQAGKKIEIIIEENLRVSVRDYGRGIPQGKLIEAVSVLNTGGKYDSKAFKKSVGLNGVGVKAVNALSSRFEVRSYRDGKVRIATFAKGDLLTDTTQNTTEENGTYIFFEPDNLLFENYSFRPEFVETMLRNYTYLNTGLAIIYNGQRILSRNGLVDLLNDNMTAVGLYPIIHLKGEDIEIAFTHTGQYGEEYYSFVNGQHTTQGGTHQSAFKEHIARTIKEYFNKNMDYSDIRNGLVAAIAVNVEEPLFESQTKIKLGSTNMAPGGPTVNKFVGDFVKTGDVALLVGFVIVGVAVKVCLACCFGAVVHRQGSACSVVDKVHLVSGAAGRPRLAGDLAVLRGVLVGRCAAGIRHGFAGADAVGAIGVSRGFSPAGQAGKLAAVLPRQGVLRAVEIRQRIADCDAVFFFVGDAPRRAVDGHAGEQVLPVAGIVVGEGF